MANLMWTLDEEGTLRINGNFVKEDYPAPWYDHRESIKKVIVCDGVTSVGNWAFSDCTVLTIIIISDSVTSIGRGAFDGCISLRKITIPKKFSSGTCGKDLTWTLDNDCTLKIEGTGAMENYSNKYCAPWHNVCELIEKVIVGDGVISIGKEAFRDCERLKEINVLDSVIEIGAAAFAECANLETVTLPKNLLKIPGSTFINYPDFSRHDYTPGLFEDCIALKSIVIPDNVVNIGEDAFGGCENLKEIRLSDNVRHIDEWAFGGCKSLRKIILTGNNNSAQEKIRKHIGDLTAYTRKEAEFV